MVLSPQTFSFRSYLQKEHSNQKYIIKINPLEYAGVLQTHEHKMIKTLEWGLPTSVEIM